MRRHETESEFLYHTHCPVCGSHDALSVYSDGHTYCFSCATWTPAAGDNAEYRPANEGATSMSSRLIPEGEYVALKKRCLDAETCQKYGYTVGYYHGKPVHIAPYYDQKGQLCAQHLRGENKSFSWLGEAKGVQLFGQRLWRNNGGKMLVITEGEIDCLSVSQAQGNKWPVVSIPSGAQGAQKAIRDNLEFVESYDKVVLAFDNDEAGQKAAQECALLLSPGKARICTFPLKDANDMLVAGQVREMIECLWNAQTWRPDGLISGEDLWDDLIKPPVEGYQTPFPELNTVTHGLRKGELTLFTAGSGIGKSTLVNEIGYKLMMEDQLTLGVIALEENRKRTAERYAGIYLNKPLHIDREGVTEEQLKEAYNNVLASGRFWLYDHFGSSDIDVLMSKIRYMAVAIGVDFIILDHISIIVSGLDEVEESERKLIDKLMTRLRSLIEETGIGVLAIVHLKRPDKGKSFNEGRQVSLTDLRGSGSLEQLSDTVIALERNQADEEEQNYAMLRVLKNRTVGIVGECGLVKYDPDTGRLYPASPFEEDEGYIADIDDANESGEDF